jgi:hypothetical protein
MRDAMARQLGPNQCQIMRIWCTTGCVPTENCACVCGNNRRNDKNDKRCSCCDVDAMHDAVRHECRSIMRDATRKRTGAALLRIYSSQCGRDHAATRIENSVNIHVHTPHIPTLPAFVAPSTDRRGKEGRKEGKPSTVPSMHAVMPGRLTSLKRPCVGWYAISQTTMQQKTHMCSLASRCLRMHMQPPIIRTGQLPIDRRVKPDDV